MVHRIRNGIECIRSNCKNVYILTNRTDKVLNIHFILYEIRQMEWTLEEQILAFAEKRRTVLQNRGEGFYRIEEKDFTE